MYTNDLSYCLCESVDYSALSPVFSTNVVCVKTQQKHARIKHKARSHGSLPFER